MAPSVVVLDLSTRNQIDRFLDEYYETAQNAGKALKDAGLQNTQVRGLENIITSATRFSEILSYIKNQAGKDKANGPWVRVAELLLNQLQALEAKAQELGQGDFDKMLQIKLKLARGWAKQIVTHYLYLGIVT